MKNKVYKMKDFKIITEVLKEREEEEIYKYHIIDNYLKYTLVEDSDDNVQQVYEINVYELAFLCKEWAYRKGLCIYSGYSKNSINMFIAELIGWVCDTLDIKMFFESNTEIEAIIKACEWIFEKEIQEENRLQLQEDLTEYNKIVKEGL